MPGLTVADGTPRDCPSARCGAQSDTAIIRQKELGTAKVRNSLTPNSFMFPLMYSVYS